MKAVLQRVKNAQVLIGNIQHSEISNGVLVLIGIVESDNADDVSYIVNKICNLKIFEDEKGHLGRSLKETGLDLLIVSNFTLCSDIQKNRLSFLDAAKPQNALILFEQCIALSEAELGKKIKTGDFGKYMNIVSNNDGPVTLTIDSKFK